MSKSQFCEILKKLRNLKKGRGIGIWSDLVRSVASSLMNVLQVQCMYVCIHTCACMYVYLCMYLSVLCIYMYAYLLCIFFDFKKLVNMIFAHKNVWKMGNAKSQTYFDFVIYAYEHWHHWKLNLLFSKYKKLVTSRFFKKHRCSRQFYHLVYSQKTIPL